MSEKTESEIKKEQVMLLIQQINDLQPEKSLVIKEQRYEDAAKLRDKEKTLIVRLDDLTGIQNYYYIIRDSEKVLQMIETITENTEKLKSIFQVGKMHKKLTNVYGPAFVDVFTDINWDQKLVMLYKQRDEAYQVLLDMRGLIGGN